MTNEAPLPDLQRAREIANLHGYDLVPSHPDEGQTLAARNAMQLRDHHGGLIDITAKDLARGISSLAAGKSIPLNQHRFTDGFPGGGAAIIVASILSLMFFIRVTASIFLGDQGATASVHTWLFGAIAAWLAFAMALLFFSNAIAEIQLVPRIREASHYAMDSMVGGVIGAVLLQCCALFLVAIGMVINGQSEGDPGKSFVGTALFVFTAIMTGIFLRTSRNQIARIRNIHFP